jgi:prophage antirepressor-like protein
MKNTSLLRTIRVQDNVLSMYGTVEEPLFLAVEVAKMIDYSIGKTGQMLDTVDPDEKLTTTIYRSGQRREMWFLTEYGLYEVLMQSRKPIARRFKSSVKKILKDLRVSDQADIEDWLNGPDPLVDEWEQYCKDNDDDVEFAEWLKQFKGYTDDML